jgi:hypothetical protein
MSKSSILLALSVFGCLATGSVVAQNKTIVDPGVSTHNYKHPNKAAKASESQNEIRVPSQNTVERYSKMRYSGPKTSTPKYAPRPAALVVVRTTEKEDALVNPLTSSRNYKTAKVGGRTQNAALANYEVSRDSIYPNQD